MNGGSRSFSEILVASVAAVSLTLCLFGDALLAGKWNSFSSAPVELEAVFRDIFTQWLVFVCAAVYFVAFNLLRQRRTNLSFWLIANPSLWLAGILALISLVYFAGYKSASQSTQALVLIGGAALASGALVWRDWSPRRGAAALAIIIVILVVLLAASAVVNFESFPTFQYRGQARWSGWWDNPNTFGGLMGIGVVLAGGMIVQGLGFKVQSRNQESEVRSQKSGVWRWSKMLFFLAAAGVMLFGLVKSYSRGAWVGTVIGTAFLGYQVIRLSGYQIRFNAIRKNWISLTLILISIGVLALWNFRHTNHPTGRRAFSVANANDFSWRKRLAAYEGALQMISNKPWFGFGWNQPEPVYDRFYRSPNVDEGMAMQMNDYFTLGTTLGLPALGCFLAYIWLSLTRNSELGTGKGKQETEKEEHRTSNIEHPTLNEGALLAATCRAGAIVLLVGFFFDGGLFKLATGATFWILIALGQVQSSKIKVQSSVSESNV